MKAKTDSLKRDNIKEDDDSGWLNHRLVFALDKSKVNWCDNKGLLLVVLLKLLHLLQGGYIQIFATHGGESFSWVGGPSRLLSPSPEVSPEPVLSILPSSLCFLP